MDTLRDFLSFKNYFNVLKLLERRINISVRYELTKKLKLLFIKYFMLQHYSNIILMLQNITLLSMNVRTTNDLPIISRQLTVLLEIIKYYRIFKLRTLLIH